MTDTESGISARLAVYGESVSVGKHQLGELGHVSGGEEGDGDLILLAPYALPNRRARRQFKRQVEEAKVLDHPNIVRVREGATDREEDRAFLATARHPERTLWDLLQEGPLSPEVALRLTCDLLNALTRAHHRHFVHGGLDPRGVYVGDKDGHPTALISAYGLPHLVGRRVETPHGMLRADPEYAAPEVLKGQPTGPWSDVYSVGVLLFVMLTGKHPIPGEGEGRLARLAIEIAEDLPKGVIANSELSEAAGSALKRALSRDASDRFPSARAFALALQPGDPAQPENTSWADVDAEGGGCSSCAVQIPAADARTWTPQQSDRPFRCAVCAATFCGEKHWDRQSQTCYSCRGLPLPTPEGPPPADLALVLASGDLARSRKETLRALLSRESALDWMALRRGEDDAPEPASKAASETPETSSAKPAKSPPPAKSVSSPSKSDEDTEKDMSPKGSSRVSKRKTSSRRVPRPPHGEDREARGEIKDALVDAWTTARRDDEGKATRRLEERSRGGPLASAEQSDEAIPRAARPAAARPFGAHDEPLPPVYSAKAAGKISLVAVGLLILLIYGGLTARRDQKDLAEKLAVSERFRSEFEVSLREVQTQSEQSREQVGKLNADLKAQTTHSEELEQTLAVTQGQVLQAKASLREATTESEAVKARVVHLKTELSAKAADLVTRTEEVKQKTAELTTLERKWGALDQRFVALKANLDESLAALTVSRATGEERARELLAREAEWSRGNAALELDLAKVRRAVQDARTQLATALQAAELGRATLSELRAQVDAGAAQTLALQTQRSELNARVSAAELLAATARRELVAAKVAGPSAGPLDVSLAVVSAVAAAAQPATMAVSQADASALFRAAGADQVLLVVHVRCDPPPAFPVHLSARIAGAPALQVFGEPLAEEGALRFWVHASQARALSAGAGAVEFSLSGSPANLTAIVRVVSAKLTASPISADVKARLSQLESSSR